MRRKEGAKLGNVTALEPIAETISFEGVAACKLNILSMALIAAERAMEMAIDTDELLLHHAEIL